MQSQGWLGYTVPTMSNTAPCRCGHAASDAPHPCHRKGYTCGKPAKQRFYAPKTVSLSGVMMKVAVTDTWACDDCWANFAS